MPSVDCVQTSSFLKNLFSYSNLFNNLVDNIENWYCKVRHLLQNGTDSSYQKFITKCESGLLQSASGITKCDKLLLQNMSGITKWCVAMITHTQSYVFQFQNFKPPWKMGTYIKWTFPETELATNKSKGQTMCHLYSIQICSKQNAQSIWTSFQTGWKYKNKYEKQLP